jgi:hypothetical protein
MLRGIVPCMVIRNVGLLEQCAVMAIFGIAPAAVELGREALPALSR